jgi:hypothetical protein
MVGFFVFFDPTIPFKSHCFQVNYFIGYDK